tara:strand:+ start:316 stop:699 length:384 start_codon:yes stop_codon:yes gene_type:complete
MGNISFLIFLRFCFVIKKGDKIKEAMNNLENTRVIGPTSGAATLINKKEAPQATPIASIRDQSMAEFLFILFLELSFLVRSISNNSYPFNFTNIRPVIRIGIMLTSSVIPESYRIFFPSKSALILRY